MTPDPIESAGIELFGESWKGTMSRALGVDFSTLWRQRNRARLPGPVQASIAVWLTLSRSFGILPPETPLGPFRTRHAPGSATGADMMDPVAFLDDAAKRLFGNKPKHALARALGLDATTLWRQTSGSTVSGPVIAAVRGWDLLYSLTLMSPPPAPWEGHLEEDKPPRPRNRGYQSLLD